MPDSPDWLILTGQHHHALVPLPDTETLLVHRDILPDWQRLQDAAAAAGFSPRAASAYRSFERQRAIWNSKADGTRAVLDTDGLPLDIHTLSPAQQLVAILRWSAIPGCSRHHWGSDLDIYDAASVPADYRLQLTAAECSPGGPFHRFHQWLDSYLSQPDAGFFRPYDQDRGGIAPERWHLSHTRTAARFERLLEEQSLADWLARQDIALMDQILLQWPSIFHRDIRPTRTA